VTRPGEEAREVVVELAEHPDQEGVAYLGVRYRILPRFHVLEVAPMPFEELPEGELPPGEFFRMFPGRELAQGAVIRSVAEDSPAAAADLREGDVITAIDGEPIERPEDLSDAVAEHEPGDRVTLTVYRPGGADTEAEERDLEVTLAEHPEAEGTAYLGVTIGGFLHMRRFEDGRGNRELFDFDFDFDFEAPLDDLPLDELPFDLDDMPHRFQFHFPPEPAEGGAACCGGDI